MRKNIIRNSTLVGLILSFVLAFTACSNADTRYGGTETQVSVSGVPDVRDELAEERKSVDSEDDEQLANASTDATESDKNADINTTVSFNYKDIPKYSGEPYADINKGIPYFTEDDMTTESFESYSKLDKLGRCGTAFACIGTDTMPTEERGKIGMIKPSGWHTVKYPGVVDGLYVYNRCHLIAYCLTAENANEKNLITGTRSMNVDGMLPFETKTAQYVENTGNHVLYRVTPVFKKNDLVCRGVLMEAYSVEDDGKGIQFCVFCYNVQEGIKIDYETGETSLKSGVDTDSDGNNDDKTSVSQKVSDDDNEDASYVLNTNTKKFHYPSCSSVKQMSDRNRQDVTESRDELIAEGYSPCKNCNP